MRLLSLNSILKELDYVMEHSIDIDEFIDGVNTILEANNLNDAEYKKVTAHLRLDVLDIDEFVKVNNCQEITNPRAFVRPGVNSDDGLLSNKIFGITAQDRSGIFAYIDLHGWFMDPSCYKAWIRLDRAVRDIVHGVRKFRLDENGFFVEDESGDTGIKWLHSIIDKVNFRKSKSQTKDISIQYLEMNRNRIFINKYIVIPPFFRDKNTANSNGSVGLGGVNKLYTDLIVACNALSATQDFLFDASDAMNGRVQEIILNIYDWFCGNSNKNIRTEMGTGLSGKTGILRRAVMSKTANFSSRLVISAAELKAPTAADIKVDFDHSAIPLYSAMGQFRDFVMFHVRRFFENEFMGAETYPVRTKDGMVKYIKPEAPEIVFSDDRIKQEMDRFLRGYNNRFVPIQIPVEGTDEVYWMAFKGQGVAPGEGTKNPSQLYQRRLTWCDVFYMATIEATKDKHVLITRFPIDSFSNQITTKILVSSTKETEPMYVENEFYKYYPKIRESDIGKDTSNSFVDTLQLSNLYLDGMGADFDGDTVTCKGVYTNEANDELEQFMNSKENFINFGCTSLRTTGSDVIQSLYALTKVLSSSTLTPDKNIIFK